ncbi:hypothetical protein [Photobacterium leiognathi]|nr:hypothetical protein [Photobacterium leiognathi]
MTFLQWQLKYCRGALFSSTIFSLQVAASAATVFISPSTFEEAS